MNRHTVVAAIFLFLSMGAHAQQSSHDEILSELLTKVTTLSAEVTKLQKQLSEQPAIPKGAVVAFDLATGCPGPAWDAVDDYRGRVIVAAGSGKGLTPRDFRAAGGEETHALTIPEMPAHSHPVETSSNVLVSATNIPLTSTSGLTPRADGVRPMSATGTATIVGGDGKTPGMGNAHNIMQPFLVLYLCRKS